MRFDASGTLSVLAYEASAGGPWVGPSPVWRVEGDGTVSSTSSAYPDMLGKMSPRKDLVFYSASLGTDTGTLRVAQKVVPGTAYSAADLAGTWTFHTLLTGTAAAWEHGVAVIEADGSAGFTEILTKSGPGGDAAGTLEIDAEGLVTRQDVPSFRGFLSADKTHLVATFTTSASPPTYGMTVFVRRTTGFVAADLAGRYRWAALFANPSNGLGGWVRGGLEHDASGNVTVLSSAQMNGMPLTVSPYTVAITSDGVITQTSPAGSVRHGVLSPRKDFIVTTNDTSSGTSAQLVLTMR